MNPLLLHVLSDYVFITIFMTTSALFVYASTSKWQNQKVEVWVMGHLVIQFQGQIFSFTCVMCIRYRRTICLFVWAPRHTSNFKPVSVLFESFVLMCTYDVCLVVTYDVLAGLPGFARDRSSIIMSICAFHFYIIYFHFFSADHGIPQTFDYILTT